ncbi:MAG TPA: permease prefix domain 1-containing protein [Armatimonadota bacterium]|jgi:hypothetical protein
MKPNDTIAGYLLTLRRRLLLGAETRDRIIAEVEDHLEESARALREAGRTPAAAEREAVARFGDPTRTALRLQAARINGKGLILPLTLLACIPSMAHVFPYYVRATMGSIQRGDASPWSFVAPVALSFGLGFAGGYLLPRSAWRSGGWAGATLVALGTPGAWLRDPWAYRDLILFGPGYAMAVGIVGGWAGGRLRQLVQRVRNRSVRA